MYQDKLAHLKKQFQQLEDGVHPEYTRRLRKVEQVGTKVPETGDKGSGNERRNKGLGD